MVSKDLTRIHHQTAVFRTKMLLEVLGVFVTFFYLVWFYLENFRDKGCPPGPISIPPFGTLIQIGLKDRIGYVALMKLAKQYGDIMSIRIGSVQTVVLSSHPAMRAVFTKEESYARPCTGTFYDRNLKQNIGIIFSEGPEHDEMRKFTRDTLRIYGYGQREAMQTLLQDELTEFLLFMEECSKSNPNHTIHFTTAFFVTSFLNIMYTLVARKRFRHDDPELQNLAHNLHEFVKQGVSGVGLLTAYPFLRHVFPETLGYNIQMKTVRAYHDAARKHLRERRLHDYREHPECFADHFLQKMDQESSNPRSLYTEDQFAVMFADIMFAGGETTSNLLTFIVLHLAANPLIQEKVYREIIHVIGKDNCPDLRFRPEMPYTQAVVLEGLRWTRVTSVGVPRRVLKDFKYQGYLFKKDTMVLFNGHYILSDPKIWGDPEVFWPERFFEPDGSTIDGGKVEIVNLINFGAGKRVCFGEVLARDSLFLFATSLVQRFKFSIPEGVEPDIEPAVGLLLSPKPFDAIVTLR